ncbi:alanyl-tRNA editing protein AlaX-M [Nanoarchaeota archaeon]
MVTKFLYWYDCYKKEFDAKVVKIDGNKVILDQTLFHPRSGGVANDTGKIIFNNEEYNVLEVIKDGEDAIHILDKEPKFKEGDNIHGIIDWNRRYKLMKLHTAAHILAAIAYKKYNALITGGDITPEYAKDDYDINLSGDELKKAFEEIINEANEIIKKGIPVKIYFLKKEEALKIPGIVKLMEKSPPDIDTWRIVEIEGIDIQADGGPHVSNTKEIGKIELLKIENKGKNRKRLYYTIKE